MIGTTLEDIRDHIETLASERGEYYLVCSRYGDRPVPAAALRFEDRSAARAAARATEQYRAALRQYDPQLPYYDVIACEDTDAQMNEIRPTTALNEGERQFSNKKWTLSEPVVTGETVEPRRLIEFCHQVAAAVFETLSEGGYDTVETAVMDTYFELAETVEDPDDLCLCLLESMAAMLETHLESAEQAALLSGAADRLDPLPECNEPIEATFRRLQRHGLVESYTLSPWSASPTGARSIVVHLPEYVLSPRSGRLAVFPIIVDFVRHGLQQLPSAVRAATTGDGWRLTFVLAAGTEPDGLASAPIHSPV
jgi:hypothetical protein